MKNLSTTVIILTPPLGKTLIQNIWSDFGNMKTLFQTFGGEILKI